MDLRDSGEGPATPTGRPGRAEVAPTRESTGKDPRPADPVEWVADHLERDPDAAADAVGGLLEVAREGDGAARVAAGEALDAIGRRHPRGLEVWSDLLARAATDADEEVAFFAMRALAQLAARSPRAAARGLAAALDSLGAPHPVLRQAALSVVAEVGPLEVGAVERADRPIAAALACEDPGVRTAAAIAAGRLLVAAPGRFPRTATALLDAVEDDDERVREYALVALANVAGEHPSNVPERERAIAALAAASDDDLGLRRGTIGEALSALVSFTFRADAGPG